jgi:hypothetical protein
MSFLKKLFKTNKITSAKPKTITDFWQWFEEHADELKDAVIRQDDLQKEFIEPVFTNLERIAEGVFLLIGKEDDGTIDIIFTADGNIKNFPLVISFVEKAPTIPEWKFTAFKPKVDLGDKGIHIKNLSITRDTLQFYPTIDEQYPDEISIHLVYNGEVAPEDQNLVENASFIYVENLLGEINLATRIDQLIFDPAPASDLELVSIEKLEEYLNWREKEFVELYEGVVYQTEKATYSSLEWESEGKDVMGTCNEELIKWNKKASHPWMVVIMVDFGTYQKSGLPTSDLLDEIHAFEDDLKEKLPDPEGYLQVGQTTGKGERTIYYACKEFSIPIQKLEELRKNYSFNYDYEVFKDKYWKCMEMFQVK